jgi:hypothetical protein
MASLGALGRKYLPDLIYGAHDGVLARKETVASSPGRDEAHLAGRFAKISD